MKKTMILFALFVSATFSSFAEEKNVQEPEFVGEAFIINEDGSILDLEKEQVQLKTKAGVSVYLTGIGKVKTKINIPGCCSNAVCKPENELKIVVKATDNETDPLSIIQVFKFNKKKKKRLAELASLGTFSGASSNNLDYLKFKAKKHGKSSYLLIIKSFERGEEYGIIVNNPNALDQRNTIVSTFGIQ